MSKLTVLRDDIKNGNISVKKVLDDIYLEIEKKDKIVNSFLSLTKEYSYKRAESLQNKLNNGEDIGILGGIPIAIKDNIAMKDIKLTCGSRMLENYTCIYDATVVKKLEQAGAVIIGKTNLDEFAMGSSTENSAFKITKNPYDISRVPGGSSGGSAACLASDFAYASIGSDTGGSIRQPASYCNLFGLKPSYGLVSRYGLVAYASSFDQIGPFTKSTEDMALMLNVLTGKDIKDATSIDSNCDYTKYLINDITNLKIGVPYNFLS
ncbi:MAG: amidase, partial [Clostridia bacterium]